MNKNRNVSLRNIKNLHFVGIGGAGMSGIAEVFHNLNYKVSGSDIAESATVQHLRAEGINVFIGHKAENIKNVHVVVVSTAIDENNAEIRAAREQRIPIVRRAEMLAELMRFRQGIAVAGTHGKTSTTSLVASVMAEGELDPTYVIGGKLNSSARHAKLGAGEYLVAEADESDASFLYLQPVISIITNIDQDHLGTYEGDFERLKNTFVEFLHHLPFYGLAIVCIDDPVVESLLDQVSRPVLTYGEHQDADIRISDIKVVAQYTHFNVHFPDQVNPLAIKLKFSGKHNALNATAAIALAWELGISNEAIQAALSHFEGINRRFQVTENVNVDGTVITHIDDYGHHPNEIKSTLQAVKAGWPDQRMVVAFQPHRYTRTHDLFEDFVAELSAADHLLLAEVYPAGEKPIKDADGRSLSGAIRARGQVNPVFVESMDELSVVIPTQLQQGDVLITLGAGSIGQFAVELLNTYSKAKEVN